MTTPDGDRATLRDARAAYWTANGFGADGGASLRWVPIKIGRVTVMYIPNTEGRRRAVGVHDLHHVLTGYRTDLVGEAEIAAWELSTGCWGEPAAFLLNLAALTLGVVLSPRRVMAAWSRGRRSANLYGRCDDALLGRRVDEVRRELRLA